MLPVLMIVALMSWDTLLMASLSPFSVLLVSSITADTGELSPMPRVKRPVPMGSSAESNPCEAILWLVARASIESVCDPGETNPDELAANAVGSDTDREDTENVDVRRSGAMLDCKPTISAEIEL